MPPRPLALTLLALAPALLGAQDASVKDAFEAGKNLWASAGDREGASAKFELVAGALQAKGKALSAPERQMLCQAYNWLAVLDDRSPATKPRVAQRFQALLDLNPDFDLDRDISSARLVSAFEAQRTSRFGLVHFSLEPSGGTFTIDGLPVPAAPTRWLSQGAHQVAYARPGYRSQEQTFEVAAKGASASFRLERVSSVLRVFVIPSGAEILLDGASLGKAGGTLPPEERSIATTAGVAPEQVSAPFLVDGLKPGPHTLELKAPCFKPKTVRIPASMTEPMADHDLEAFRLDPSQGTLTVTAPVEAALFLDGEAKGKVPVADLSVCSGAHELEVKFPAGGFTRHIEVQEGKPLSVEARPRPRLAYVGVDTAEDFSGRLRMGEVMQGLGPRLTQVAYLAPQPGETAQAALARLKAARAAELFLSLRPVGDPASPQIEYTVSTPEGESEKILARPFEQDPLATLVARLNALPPASEPGAGITLVDVAGEPGPILLSADADALKAGLQLNRPLTAAGGKPVASVAEFRASLASAGERLQVSQGTVNATLAVRAQALELPMVSENYCYPALMSHLRLRLLGAKGDEAGLARLDLALGFMHFRKYDQALEVLREARLSSTRGVSQGSVEYYTALCFQRLGPAYANEALAAFQRALRYPSATLLSSDGPLVAPLAKQALEDLKP
ncbi:MAG TPA: hypothetical protein VJ600_10185 [Holophagaceae bacterium]|nr:hypothetical protein [Holophagaceae bacterium]